MDLEQLAKNPFGDHLQQTRLVLEVERRRHHHGHPVAGGRCRPHLPRLLEVHGHSGFGEQVLARRERFERDGAVHVRPGADADRIDVLVAHQRPPVIEDLGYAELLGHPLARLLGAVAHGDNLHTVDGLKTRNVAGARVGAGPYDTDT